MHVSDTKFKVLNASETEFKNLNACIRH